MLTENNKKRGDDGQEEIKKPTDADIIQQGKVDGGDTIAAHHQAENDIEQDPDFSEPTPNDDLDEGEGARLGEGKNELI
ncbi:MAG: hypothetical protein WKF89_02845 [Chitinophagaceae bacterium]